MSTELDGLIRERLRKGETIPAILVALHGDKWNEADIDAALKRVLAPPPVAAAPALAPAVAQTPAKGGYDLSRLDATRTFVVIGILLIVIALIIVISLQWESSNNLTRIGFVNLPMLLLLAISAVMTKDEKYLDIHEGTLATALTIFPFALGITIHQLGIIAEFEPILVVITALISYMVMTLVEFVFNKRKFSLLTILYLYAFVASLLLHFKIEGVLIGWIMFILSTMVGFFGFTLLRKEQSNAPAYLATGTALSAALLPFSILYSLNESTPLGTETNAVIISIFSFLYLGLSVFFSQMAEAMKKNVTLYQLKRGFEELAPLVFLMPYIFIGFNEVGYMILALTVSFAFVFASISIPIGSLLPIGAIGMVVGILSIAAKYFVDTLSLPIVVLMAGFAMIGLSFFIRRVSQLREESAHKTNKWGLGEDPAYATADKHPAHLSPLTVLGIIVLLLAVGPWLIFSAIFH